MNSKWCVVDMVRTPTGAIVWIAVDREDTNRKGVGVTINSAISNLFTEIDDAEFNVQLSIANVAKNSVYLEA